MNEISICILIYILVGATLTHFILAKKFVEAVNKSNKLKADVETKLQNRSTFLFWVSFYINGTIGWPMSLVVMLIKNTIIKKDARCDVDEKRARLKRLKEKRIDEAVKEIREKNNKS